MKNGDTITTKEAAQIMGCSVRTVQRMIDRGSLDAHKLDPNFKSVYRVSRKQVLDLAKKSGAQPIKTR